MSSRTGLRRLPSGVVLALAFSAFGIVADAGPLPPGAGRSTIVDCGLGQRISPRVTTARTAVIVRGTCVENVLVAADDVSIRTDGITPATIIPADPSQAAVVVEGARRVAIGGGAPDGLTINGGTFGIVATRGAAVDLNNCVVTGTTSTGVVASNSSSLVVDNCRITGNTGNGAAAANASSLYVTNSVVSGNTLSGIVAVRTSYVRVGQDVNSTAVLRPVTVSGNGVTGLTVAESSSGTVVATAINGNGANGISVSRASSAQIGIGINGLLGPNTINNNGDNGVSIFQSSQALIRGNIIQDHPGGTGVAVTTAAATIIGNQIRRSGSRGVSVAESGSAKIGVLDGNDGLLANIIENNGDDGIGVFNGAAAVIGGNTIQSNAGDGVDVARAMGRFVGSNVIQLNAGQGVNVTQAQVFQGLGQFGVPNVAETIQNNTLAGINASNGASLDLQSVLVQNNGQRGILMSNNVSARLQTSTIRNNTGDGISLLNASTLLHIGAPSNMVITGNTGVGIQCFDGESSFAGDLAGVTGNSGGQVSCTGF
jgi:hypothetical protein